MTLNVYQKNALQVTTAGLEQTLRQLRRLVCEPLYETRARKLERYGQIDPTLAETLDPHVEKLIALVLEIEQVVKKP